MDSAEPRERFAEPGKDGRAGDSVRTFEFLGSGKVVSEMNIQ